MSTVRAAGQNNSNSGRNWDQEVIAHLDNCFKDWKDLTETYMVPHEFPSVEEPNPGEKTEEDFFNLLKTFGESR